MRVTSPSVSLAAIPAPLPFWSNSNLIPPSLAFVERYYGKFEETELDAHWRLLAPMPP